jgi:hypothetical protein
MRGQALTAIVGGDRPMTRPLEVKWEPPKPKPKGLDWSKHRAPDPEPAPVVEQPEATVSDIRERIKRTTKPRAPKPPHPRIMATCECGQPHSPQTKRCRSCHKATRTPTRTSVVDTATARAEYLAGATIPQIAADHDWPVVSVRRQLQRAGVPMRDDRNGHSGSKPKVYPAELVAEVRRLYLDQGLSQAKIAHQLGTTPKVIVHLMKREGIPARQGANGGGDTLKGYRERLDQLGVSSRTVRDWARANGRPVGIRGVIPEHILDAYEEAHRE